MTCNCCTKSTCPTLNPRREIEMETKPEGRKQEAESRKLSTGRPEFAAGEEPLESRRQRRLAAFRLLPSAFWLRLWFAVALVLVLTVGLSAHGARAGDNK